MSKDAELWSKHSNARVTIESLRISSVDYNLVQRQVIEMIHRILQV